MTRPITTEASTIWKFQLEAVQTQFVEIPLGGIILSAGIQYGDICIWVQVDPHASLEARTLEVFGTGHTIPPGNRKYIGTVQLQGGGLIFHVYERVL